MPEHTREEFDKHRRNVRRIVSGGGSEADVNSYLQSRGLNDADVVRPPDFVDIPAQINPDTGLDFPAVDPNAARMAGGITGATMGAGLGPLGSLAGGALLQEAAGQGAELYNKFLAGTRDDRTVLQRGTDAAQSIALDAAAAGVAGEIPRLAKGVLGAVTNPVRNRLAGQGARETAADFAGAGVPLRGNAGAISGNRAVQGTEQALAKLPSSARTMQIRATETVGSLADQLETIARGFGKARTPFKAGTQIIKGVDSFALKFRERGKVLFDRVRESLPGQTPVAMDDTRAFIGENLAAFQNAPEIQGIVVSPKLKGILAAIDRSGGELTWEQASRLRSAIGEQIADPRRVVDAGTGELKALYSNLTVDMERVATGQGGDVLKVWNRAKDFWSGGLERMDLLESITRSPQAEKAFNAALSGAREGPTLLRALKKSIPGDQWGDFVAVKLQQMGLATPGAQGAAGDLFSPNTFLTNWNRLAPEAKKVLFGGSTTLRVQLDRLTRVMASLRDVESMANRSGTAGQNVFMGLIQGQTGVVPGAGLGFAAGGPIGSAVGSVAGFGVATGLPLVSAKLMTSEKFVRWLIQGVQIPAQNFNSISTHVGRLTQIALSEPDLRADVEKLQTGLELQ